MKITAFDSHNYPVFQVNTRNVVAFAHRDGRIRLTTNDGTQETVVLIEHSEMRNILQCFINRLNMIEKEAMLSTPKSDEEKENGKSIS